MAEEKKPKEYTLRDNEAVTTLSVFCKGMRGYAMSAYEEEHYIFLGLPYGQTKINAYYLYTGNQGAITDVVFDLRGVYEAYGASYGSFENFLSAVAAKASMQFFTTSWKSYIKEDFTALGCQVAGKSAAPYNKYCVWAPSLECILKALDSLLSQHYCEVSSDKVNEVICSGYKKAYNVSIGIAAAILAGGLALLILGILATINKVVGYLFGIILILIGGICLAAFISGKKETIVNYMQNKEDEKFFTATNSQFK